MNNIHNNDNYNLGNNNNFESPIFQHSQKFMKQNNKIKKQNLDSHLNQNYNPNYSSNNDFFENNVKEGYVNMNETNLEATNITQESVNILNNTNQTPSQIQATEQMIASYNNLLAQYQSQLEGTSNTIQNYLARVSSSNPYLGKNIRITETGAIYYVTQQGVAKWYPSMDVYNNIVGNNGCPPAGWIEMSVPNIYKSNNLSPGTIIPTTPPLIVGTPMVPGQSCGNEGSNVIVNNVLNNTNSTFLGNYKVNPNSIKVNTYNNQINNYSFGACQEQAILTSSSYFGLQNVDKNTGMGNCIVSNNLNQMTSLGKAQNDVPTILWSSNTASLGGVSASLTTSGTLAVYDANSNIVFQSPLPIITVPTPPPVVVPPPAPVVVPPPPPVVIPPAPVVVTPPPAPDVTPPPPVVVTPPPPVVTTNKNIWADTISRIKKFGRFL